MNDKYVHGYSEREADRLSDQANTLTELLHSDTVYPSGSMVLEAGCGVGAQTVILAGNNPDAKITSIDISSESMAKAKSLIEKAGITNVKFQIADIFNLPFQDNSFDHIFVCFVLEHLQEPVKALLCLKRVLKPEGTITVIEGDHGSCYFYPESKDAIETIQCLVKIQESLKGNSLIGRQVYPILKDADFRNIRVSPRMVYVDSSKPELVDGFTKKTFIAMVEGVKKQALELGMMDEKSWDKGISDLYRTTADDGVFCYTFFKGVAIK
ncbi:MAG: class I SAM-dependent methyltransferase [Candidatus Poribacteria bacterium]